MGEGSDFYSPVFHPTVKGTQAEAWQVYAIPFHFLNVFKEPAVHLRLCKDIHLQPAPHQAVPLGTCGACSSRDLPAGGWAFLCAVNIQCRRHMWLMGGQLDMELSPLKDPVFLVSVGLWAKPQPAQASVSSSTKWN